MSPRSARRELPPFTRAEFEARAERARRMMTAERLDALLVTSEANVEYLSGFTTQFAWNTPTRPWYFVLPRTGRPVAVIPEIGVENWKATSWVDDVRAWPSPRPADEGLTLLADALQGLRRRFGRVGAELGPESRLGMPVADLRRLERRVRPLRLADAVPVLRSLRLVKSAAEVARIGRACDAASAAFEAIPDFLEPGMTETEVVRRFQAEALLNGADKVPFAAIGSGRGGYRSIIMGPTTRRIREGDLFLIDTGARYGGYFCDFDRNFAVGRPPSDAARRAHEALWLATEAGIDAARPGATAEDVFRAQASMLEARGLAAGSVGRLGHGLGKVLTEPPSNMAGDATVLQPGTVLTIEPSARFGRGKIMVHEENLVVTEDRPVVLSQRAPREMPVIGDIPLAVSR